MLIGTPYELVPSDNVLQLSRLPPEVHPYYASLHLPAVMLLTELYPNAKHHSITATAPSGGLPTLSVNVGEGPTFIVTVPSQGTPWGLAASGAGRCYLRL